ncbi:MAG TPA: hypothetical protein VEF55_02985 [Candidatus Binatia bacterium]|nr:hypothetical protein [Candidatus Binatia bacterium]
MRGLFRYQTAKDRWWATVEDDNGARVNMMRNRYEQMRLEPPFDTLPIEDRDGSKKSKHS